MTRLFSAGFEFNDLLEASSNTGGATSSVQAHSGSFSCLLNVGELIKFNFTSAEFYSRLYWFTTDITVNKTLYVWNNPAAGGNGNLGSITFQTSNGKINAFVTNSIGVATLVFNGTTTILANTWYRIELYTKLSTTVGVITLNLAVNDAASAQEGTFSGNTLQWGAVSNSTNTIVSGSGVNANFFDDIGINDALGANDNSFPGPEGFFALVPNGAGALTQITNVVGAATHWQAVSEAPPDGLTSYVWGDDVDLNKIDLYDLTAFTPGNGGIQRVVVDSRMSSDVAGGTIQLSLRTQNINYFSGTNSLTTSFNRYINEYLKNPNTGVAWTVSDLQALQVGGKIV